MPESGVPGPTGWRKWLITIFILVHLYIMAFWGLPGSRFRYVMVQPVEDYVIQSGLWHSWDMFSPDPLSLNFILRATIRFQDGSTKVWDFPRMEKLGYWERFQKERFRKWRERVRQDVYNGVWDDTCRYIARLHDSPTNHPVEITLTRQWDTIPAPRFKGGLEWDDYQPMPKHFDQLRNSYNFRYYTVKLGDL